MKPLATSLFCLILLISAQAQQRTFQSRDSRLKVYYGDTVSILADSAYIVSAAQALLLNEKLLELKAAQLTNQELHATHAELLDRVGEIEQQVSRLLSRLQSEHRVMEENLVLLLSELDQSIAILQQANTELTLNNTQLNDQLALMDQTVRHLRKENRRLGWHHLRDKAAIAILGLSLGYLLGNM
tara:strand:- start:800 stop:1354 length:555 start_codon:yes stop_codon:yes gene_type:complete